MLTKKIDTATKLKALTLDNIQVNTFDSRFTIEKLRSIHAVNSRISGFDNPVEFFQAAGGALKKINMQKNRLTTIPMALSEYCQNL